MSKTRFENRIHIYVFVFLYAIASFVVSGCEKKELKVRDPNMDVLRRWSSLKLGSEEKERLNYAMNTYSNGKVDSAPILIRAVLDQSIGSRDIVLFLAILDEDKDILGFSIREEIYDSNGTVETIEEEYPVFAHHPETDVVNFYAFDISVRRGKSKKNEKAWNDYLTMDFDAQVRKLELPSPSENSFASELERFKKIVQLWKSSLPTIFISLPDPGKLNIWIQVYDKAGNISNTVDLVDHTLKGTGIWGRL